MTCPHRIDVAAYLLNALEPAEFEEMRAHVPTCWECLHEHDDLYGTAMLLSTLTPADVEAGMASAEPSEAPEPPRRRRYGIRQLAVVVAVVLVFAGAGAALAVAGRQPPIAHAVTVSATDPQTQIHANATLTSHDWGTQIGLKLSGVAPAQQCILVVSAADGRQDTAATWVATYQGAVDVASATAIPAAQIRRLDIVTASGHELISITRTPVAPTERR